MNVIMYCLLHIGTFIFGIVDVLPLFSTWLSYLDITRVFRPLTLHTCTLFTFEQPDTHGQISR